MKVAEVPRVRSLDVGTYLVPVSFGTGDLFLFASQHQAPLKAERACSVSDVTDITVIGLRRKLLKDEEQPLNLIVLLPAFAGHLGSPWTPPLSPPHVSLCLGRPDSLSIPSAVSWGSAVIHWVINDRHGNGHSKRSASSPEISLSAQSLSL